MASKTKKPGKAIIPWEQEMAQAAKKQSEAPKVGGGGRTFISCKGGVMSIGDKVIKEKKVDVVILDFAYVNAYYDKPFNPKQPASPACFAIGREHGSLAPHKEATDPQNDKCLGCPQNEFGSRGDGGPGKACKNGVRLALMVAGDLEKDIGKANIVYLNVPPTSMKAFGGFYKEECCSDEGDPVKPTFAFVTTIEVEPDQQVMFRVHFNRPNNQVVTREQFYALRDKVDALKDDVLFPFPKLEEGAKKGKAQAAPARRSKY